MKLLWSIIIYFLSMALPSSSAFGADVSAAISTSTAAVALPVTPSDEGQGSDPLIAGHRLYFAGRLTEALDAYKPYLERTPDAVLQSSVILQGMGKLPDTIALLSAARSHFPQEPRIPSALAWAYVCNDDPVRARAVYQGMTSLTARDLLGQVLAALRQGATGDAVTTAKSLAQRQPTSGLAYFLQSIALEKTGQYDEAAQAAEEAVKRDAFFGEARLALARVSEKARRWEESWRSYAKLLQFDADDGRVYEGLSRTGRHLPRKSSEILPPHRITASTAITSTPASGGRVRIGIGTSASGKPSRQFFWAIRPSGAFSLYDRKSGGRLASGFGPGEWKIQIDPLQRRRAVLLNPDGQRVAVFRGAALLRGEGPAAKTFIVNSLHAASGSPWAGMSDKEFRGELEIKLDTRHRTLILVNILPIEEYVYGVLAAEMPQHWPLEALKSQAVISRTMTLYCRQIMHPHRRYGYDLCDGQHCQVYTGVGAETPNVYQATDGTRGRYVAYGGSPAHTIFTSNCGGHTQNGVDVGWGSVPYWQSIPEQKSGLSPQSPRALEEWLEGLPEAFCNVPQYVWPAEFRWVRVATSAEIRKRWRGRRRIGDLLGIIPLKRSSAGNVLMLELRGSKGNILLRKEHEIRRLLTIAPLRSTEFVVHTLYVNGKPSSLIFFGGGWGHGLGLCQSGAAGRAVAGFTYDQILSAYYPGTTLKTLE